MQQKLTSTVTLSSKPYHDDVAVQVEDREYKVLRRIFLNQMPISQDGPLRQRERSPRLDREVPGALGASASIVSYPPVASGPTPERVWLLRTSSLPPTESAPREDWPVRGRPLNVR